MSRVLVIADNQELGRAVATELRRADHVVALADRASAIEVAYDCSPEILVVDASDDASPARICRQIRREPDLKEAPILAIIARSHMDEMSPRYGLDDFVISPPAPGEVSCRVKMALWRTHRAAEEDLIQVRDIVINTASYEVSIKGAPVALTYKEYELLKFLAMNPGRVFTRENLLNRVWGFDFYGGTRTVDVHIRRIRSKIGDQHESLIQTVRNVGYRFSVAMADSPADVEAKSAVE